jgi:parallel beta-helix repeat protein
LNRLLNLAALGTLTIGLAVVCIPATAGAAKTVLYPGDSIQAAVDIAAPGDQIIVMPGEYFGPVGADEAVRIKKDGISLIGKPDGDDKVILRPNPDGSNEDGILVEPDGGDPIIQGSHIQGITVEGFPGNGIKVEFVNNFKILDNESINNLENGIQPELSANGLVKNNLSYGSLDSALWVEGGTNVRVIGNVLHSSTTGLEVTISKDLVIVDNEMYNNTVGMGLYHPSAASEPPLPVMEDWKVLNNYIHDNNLPNGASGGLPALLPPGGGILLMGVSDNMLEGNRVENNDFYGLAIIDFCLSNPYPEDILSCEEWNSSGADPVPRNNKIADNTFVNNGTNAPGGHPLAPYAADIIEGVFDPSAGNCFEENSYTTYASLVGAPAPQACP